MSDEHVEDVSADEVEEVEEEVQMSVLDALKEVSSRTRMVYFSPPLDQF